MYLGIDFGKKRIGLALGEILPKGAGVLDGTKKISEIADEIGKVCRENEVETIVVGFPRKPSGDEGELAGEIKDLAKLLEQKLKIPVKFEEEEFTSVEAESFLKQYGKNYNPKSGKVDEIAAVLILEKYLRNKKD